MSLSINYTENFSVNFYEIFNKTDQLKSHAEAHKSFVTNIKYTTCAIVTTLKKSEQCAFTKKTEECNDKMNYIDYIQFAYCNDFFPTFLTVFCLFIWCCYLFVVLGTIADKFFCPVLTAISKFLGLSETVTGVTLLAFGNGAPDIMTAIAKPEDDTELMYAELFGATAFIISVIAGSVIIVHPFRAYGYFFVRDSLFFMFAIVFISYSIHDAAVTFYESIGIILIYLIYLIVVIVDHFVWKNREIQNLEIKNIDAPKSNQSNISERRTRSKTIRKIDLDYNTLCSSINPIDVNEWNESTLLGKIAAIIKAPFLIVLILLIPIVDGEKEKNGWSKILNLIHLFTLPTFALYYTGYDSEKIYGFKLIYWSFLISFILFGIVLLTSETTRPPKYHIIYGCANFFGSILAIDLVAEEVVSILEVLGIVLNLSHSMLGLTILAWGNSIGDLISNVTLARQGYTRMGFAACFGGPLFNSLVGIGVTFLMKCLDKPEGKREAFGREGAVGPNCALFLFLIISFTLFAFLSTKYYARRSIGVSMIAMYIIFLLFCFLGEFEIIHPFGTDHRDEGDFAQ